MSRSVTDSPSHRVATALARLANIAVIQTVGTVIGWRLDSGFFDLDVVRTGCGIPLVLATPVVVMYDAIGWPQTSETGSRNDDSARSFGEETTGDVERTRALAELRPRPARPNR